MLDLDTSIGGPWDAQELGAVLRHQLAAPLPPVAGPAPVDTFDQLLRHPSPPLTLLESVKDFAKAARQNPAAGLPEEVAAVIYFAAIVVANRRCGVRISRLSDEELRSGVEWVLAQPWIAADIRVLFGGV
jgi:hypothetical protein